MAGYLAVLGVSAALAVGAGVTRGLLFTTPLEPASEVCQDDACPDPGAFLGPPPAIVWLPATSMEEAWGRVQTALTDWRRGNFPLDSNLLLRLVVEGRMPMQAAPVEEPRAALTCFLMKRVSRRTQYRMAIHVTLQPAGGQGRGPMLELRWLSGIKGPGERTWQPDLEHSAPLVEDLIRRIEDSGK